MINKEEILGFWKEKSDSDLETAQVLFESRKYSEALFFCHLSIEKFLKFLVVRKTEDHAPYDHNLIKLAEDTDLKLSGEDSDLLAEINTFNIKGRYDDYKQSFYKKATKEYAEEYINKTKTILKWLKEQ